MSKPPAFGLPVEEAFPYPEMSVKAHPKPKGNRPGILPSEAVDVERRRIAQDLHDSLGQQLTGISFLLKVVEKQIQDTAPAAVQDLKEIERQVNDAIRQTRNLALSLRPLGLSPETLFEAVQELASRTESMYGIPCGFQGKTPASPPDPVLAVQLFFLAQEAVIHAVRDRKAGRVMIRMETERPYLQLEVQCEEIQHKGKPDPDGKARFRLLECRAQALGGTLQRKRTESGGTLLFFRIRNPDHRETIHRAGEETSKTSRRKIAGPHR